MARRPFVVALLLLISSSSSSCVPAAINNAAASPWTAVVIPEDTVGPAPSMSHAAGALRNGTSLVVFGGCTSSCCFSPTDSLWELRLDPATGLAGGNWRALSTSGDGGDAAAKPGPRFSAATAVDAQQDALYVFGGQDANQAFLSELWKLELVGGEEPQARWTRLRTTLLHTPPPRGAASLSLLAGRHLVLYGGFGRDGARNDAWAFDLAVPSKGWSQLAQAKQQPQETAPLPARWHHTAVAVDDRSLVVVGGSDAEGKDAGDAWRLSVDLKTGTVAWAPLAAEGTGLSPRHGHAALAPTATAAGTGSASSLVVYGGVNTTANTLPESFLGDALRLNVTDGQWTSLKGKGPGVRAYAAIGHGPRHSVVFGGFAGYTGDVDDRLLGDVWLFRHGSQGPVVGLEGETEGIMEVERA